MILTAKRPGLAVGRHKSAVNNNGQFVHGKVHATLDFPPMSTSGTHRAMNASILKLLGVFHFYMLTHSSSSFRKYHRGRGKIYG